MRPALPPELSKLDDLAQNLRWSWHPATQDLFRRADPELWESSGGDPVTFLGSMSGSQLAGLAADRDFLDQLASAEASLRRYLDEPRWYQSLGEQAPAAVAYFSPEFGITSVLPQYSGGLGILAGDHLKSASDLGVPIIGVGLLYRHGYFKQSLSRDGWQLERYPVLDPDGLPISQLHEPDGSQTRVVVGLAGGEQVMARIWIANVGRVPLLLLDSDIEENSAPIRDITDRLYGGNTEHRLRQEMLLGIGGVRAIRAYCRITGRPAPEVFHTNEGHAGFLGVERIRELVEELGVDFDAALEVARAGTVFTTHTPVPAGIDRFPKDLVEQYFGGDNANPVMPVDRILALGTEDYESGDPTVFNMAVMGLRLAQRANGVSTLHGEVSRRMFGGLWPEFEERERPIISITNGVHAPTWVAREILEMVSSSGTMTGDEARVDEDQIRRFLDEKSDRTIWDIKRLLRGRLVDDARKRLRSSWRKRGVPDAELGWTDEALSEDVLTIGFARRVPSYKRLTLMLRDPERLKALLLDPDRPIQLIIAGKSHPADDGGKKLIQDIVRFADDPEVRHRILYLPNYDISMAQALYPGCDVWLNNPLRPYEACGTSGMKSALNGGLNLSILDGWWDEWYDGSNGWAIPSADGVGDPGRRDDLEAQSLYELLENVVAPLYYDRDHEGLPRRWLEMMRHTFESLGPKVLSNRMVADYVETLYMPATDSSRLLDGGYAVAKEVAQWKATVRAAWPEVRIDHVESSGLGDSPALGATMGVRVYVSLGSLTPDEVDVQVVHGKVVRDDELVDTKADSIPLVESYEAGRHQFAGEVTLDESGPFGYSVRVLPKHPLLASPAELGCVTLPLE